MRRLLIPTLFILSVILAYAGWASAAQDAGPAAVVSAPAAAPSSGALGVILDEVVKLVAALVAVLATWLVTRLTRVLEARTSMRIDNNQALQVADWIDEAVALAEEKAHQTIKAKAASLTGPKKLEVALDYVLPRVRDKGWLDYTRERLTSMVEAKLGMERLAGRRAAAVPPPLPEPEQ